MIQRYEDTYDGMDLSDVGYWVTHEDHLAEIEKLKPKWIAGPPTTTGWHWVKYHNNKPFFQHVSNIREDMVFIDGGHCWTSKESISYHCLMPIQEPEEC